MSSSSPDKKTTLTAEQKARIEANRKRALEIRKEREKKKQKVEKHDDDILEDFEQGASELVSKKEAAKMYCLPEGTLAVCSFVEKENPRHKGWTPMKLYDRSELRRRARKRYGGMEGLQAERKKREEKKYQTALEKTKNLF